MKPAIQLCKVSKSFGKKTLFREVEIEIPEGTITGFLGENGCGKSVLFKLISGLYRPDSGEIFIEGDRIGDKFDFPPNMGIFIDAPGFVSIYSGYQNLKFLAEILGKIGDSEIQHAMAAVGLDYNDKTHVKHYSLGMKQKLGIAQAIMENQKIILFDEPFNALDADSHRKMLQLMQDLRQEGKTILLTSHNYSDIIESCDTIYQFTSEQIIPATQINQ